MTSVEYNIVKGETSRLDWVIASSPKEGEQECADLCMIQQNSDQVLLAVVDGLGHGDEAMFASRKVINYLKSSANNSLISLIENCHEELKGTRGVVLSIARIDFRKSELAWLSVGNVEGLLMCKDEQNNNLYRQLILRSGVVGYKLPSLNISSETITGGDTLLFITDGVKSEYMEMLNYNRSLDDFVKNTAKNYFKNTDDSLILAARLRNER